MQLNELLNLINKLQSTKCETQTIEVKSANGGEPEKLYDTLSSFSNQDGGGVIIFGLDENQDFKIVGVNNSKKLTSSIQNQCAQMEPHIRPLIETFYVDEKVVVTAEIPGIDVSNRPCYYRGKGRIKGSYTRCGDADEMMTEYEIYAYETYRTRVQEDLRCIQGIKINNLDQKKLNIFFEKIKLKKTRLAELNDVDILNAAGIERNGEVTLAGLLLFGKYPQGIFPQFSITAVVIPGTNYGDIGSGGERFIDNKRIDGTIDEMLDGAMQFVFHNARTKTIIDETGKRKDKYEYPQKAVREAILNALMHRDYSFYTEGSPIQIRMFYDRMEIISPGGLYGRLTLSTLGKFQSDTRNKTISLLLEDLDIAENRYSGIPTIRHEMLEYNLPMPKFDVIRGDFVVTFYNDFGSNKNNLSIEERIIEYCIIPRSRAEIAQFVGKTQYYVIKTIINPLIEKGLLKLTLPEVPKSTMQKYVKS